MNMNNVKAITLPNSQKVKKIKNNTGKIIWADDTKYPYRQLEWIKFTGNQTCDLNGTWSTSNRAYGIQAIRDATDPNISGALAGNGGGSNNYGGYICKIGSSSGTYYFNYKAGSATSGNYILNDYFPNNSERIFWTYTGANLIALDVRNTSGTKLGDDEFAVGSGTWPGESAIILGGTQVSGTLTSKLKGVKIKLFRVANATLNSSGINVGSTVADFIPCERKSDGRLGFYNTNNKEFRPISGTTTSANVGPTVDEYPDALSINF